MFIIPQDYAFLFENSSAGQYFGSAGQFKNVLPKTFKDLQRFWDIQSSDMVLTGMHGATLRDRNKIILLLTTAYGLSPDDAAFYADLNQELLDLVPQYRNGNHPAFTFNAFAVPSFTFPPVGTIPNKIVMGDGIMEAYEAIGYGDVAPQAILAHEFGHQVQFQRNVFTDIDTPEETRRTELMADAFSAYYLSHSRGASMQ